MLVVMMSLSFIVMVVPWFLVALVVLAVIFLFFSRIFRCALRDLKRLENVSRSPIYSHVTASISGLSTLRAFKKESAFSYRFGFSYMNGMRTHLTLLLFQIYAFVWWKLFRVLPVHVQHALAGSQARFHSRYVKQDDPSKLLLISLL